MDEVAHEDVHVCRKGRVEAVGRRGRRREGGERGRPAGRNVTDEITSDGPHRLVKIFFVRTGSLGEL